MADTKNNPTTSDSPLAAQAAPRGTRDILPPDSERMRSLVAKFARQAHLRGYRQVNSPIFEHAEVFRRVGVTTEVVAKQMYEFSDKDGRPMALRPELTASIARAFAQHRPAAPWKVWYEGPLFRYEKPQSGRYRQFSQVGAELLGSNDPHADVESIVLAWRFCEALGLRRLRLLLNTLGTAEDRHSYQQALQAHFTARRDELSEQGRVTLSRNPLRLLDSKHPQEIAAAQDAPEMTTFLCANAAEHFAVVQDGLRSLGVPFESSPRLVRGLDYYQYTAFEIRSETLDGAQDAVGGGGRYDGLVADLGGPNTPGVGFALGVDRLLLACDAEGVFPPAAVAPDVFVVDLTGGKQATQLAEELRNSGINTERAFDARSMRAQMKAADRSGARLAVLIGAQELAQDAVTLRDLRAVANPRGQDVAAEGADEVGESTSALVGGEGELCQPRNERKEFSLAQTVIARNAVCEEVMRRLTQSRRQE